MDAISNALGGLTGMLSGATYNANNTGGYYDKALQNWMTGTGTGSPMAQTFSGEAAAALQPQFDRQSKDLASKEAAMGITHSGAAKADFGNLAADQSATLAGVTAPFYMNAENIAGGISSAQPGAQSGAYQQALDRFYQALTSAATGMPSMGGSTGASPQNPQNVLSPPTWDPTWNSPQPAYQPVGDTNPYGGTYMGGP